MMGYIIALLINAQFQYLDDARANLNLLIDRYYQIYEHPEQIIPLVYTKIQKINTYVWIGWFRILIASSVILHLKFTSSEISSMFNLQTTLNILNLIMTGLFLRFAVGPPASAILFILSVYIFNIFLALNTSKNHHPDGGAWISFEFFAVPPIGSYIHGMAPSGSTVYNFILDGILPAMILYGVFELMIHDWTWLSI